MDWASGQDNALCWGSSAAARRKRKAFKISAISPARIKSGRRINLKWSLLRSCFKFLRRRRHRLAGIFFGFSFPAPALISLINFQSAHTLASASSRMWEGKKLRSSDGTSNIMARRHPSPSLNGKRVWIFAHPRLVREKAGDISSDTENGENAEFIGTTHVKIKTRESKGGKRKVSVNVMHSALLGASARLSERSRFSYPLASHLFLVFSCVKGKATQVNEKHSRSQHDFWLVRLWNFINVFVKIIQLDEWKKTKNQKKNSLIKNVCEKKCFYIAKNWKRWEFFCIKSKVSLWYFQSKLIFLPIWVTLLRLFCWFEELWRLQ